MEAKTLPADICVLGHFWWLSPAAVHLADWWFDSGMKWWIHISSIVTYLHNNSFSLQTMLWIIDALLFLINCEPPQLSHWQMFMQNGEYTTFWYLQLFCYLMQLQFTISQMSLWRFLVFSRTIAKFGHPECSASFVTAFKVSLPPLNCCFRRSWVWIKLIKVLLCLNSIFFPPESNALSTHKIQIFPLF